MFGIFAHNQAAFFTAQALHALQHRGQDSAGIASSNNQEIFLKKHLGLVAPNFLPPKNLKPLKGNCAIGHTRYATQGAKLLRNAQPLTASLKFGSLALAHNGHFANASLLRKKLKNSGYQFRTTTDTEIVFALMHQSKAQSLIEAFQIALEQIQGGFGLLLLSKDMLIAARDPIGIRPLMLGYLGESPVFASESCAFSSIGARYHRAIRHGEIVVCQRKAGDEIDLKSYLPQNNIKERLCLFEYIYFSRPDSILGGQTVYEMRKKMGALLAQEAPVPQSLIVAVPDSGTAAALGFAQQHNLPFEQAILPNAYTGRSFIAPNDKDRLFMISLKYNINENLIKDQIITLVDDSLVRGTTASILIQQLKNNGAKEIHLRIACPPLRYPDYFGISIPTLEELCAFHHPTIEEMRAFLGADSLAFLSLDGVYKAICGKKRDPKAPQFTDHYFTGEYPIHFTYNLRG